MTQKFDVIVLGVGAMGSAACWRLAAEGVRVLGLEQHKIGHAYGSSHGETRLIRQAYFEHPAYVPLLRRAYTLWRDLEGTTGQSLFHQNGVVIFGPRDGVIMAGVRRSSEQYAIPVQAFDAKAAKAAFDGFVPPQSYEALLEPGAGYLDVEACVVAQADAAKRCGAILKEHETVLAVDRRPSSVVVTTKSGQFEAAKLVITAGPWSAAFLPDVRARLAVHRTTLVWFAADSRYDVGNGLPCFGFETPKGFFYGVPAVGKRGVKVGLHKPGDRVAKPEEIDRSLHPEDLAVLVDFVSACLPGVKPVPTDHAICMYTMSPDEHFIINTEDRVTYAAGFSGHGFKFAPVIGEILADLSVRGKTAHPIDFLRPRWS